VGEKVIEDILRVSLIRHVESFVLDVDLRLPGRGVTVLFGDSGCGKTSLLRGIAGLDRDVRGTLSLNGEVWLDSAQGKSLSASSRPIGYVFQDAALFPHLSVRENLVYGMNRARVSLEESGWLSIIDMFNLGPLLDRSSLHLSGGEQQRVAIARAILTRPQLLLMDEPLASLDASHKREFLPYLERLHQELDIPVIYVTHSPEEVLRLADHVVLMAGGRVEASGTLGELMPRMVAQPGFGDEAGIILLGIVKQHYPADGVSQIQFEGGSLWFPLLGRPEGSYIRCHILPADVSLSLQRPEGVSLLNILPAKIVSITERKGSHGMLVQVAVGAGASRLYARITRKSLRELDLQIGQTVYAMLKATSFDR
jgi:molybdate transport system ATP-binding protein